MNPQDDNEFARYLASYINDNLDYDWDGPIVSQEIFYRLIKEFLDTLP